MSIPDLLHHQAASINKLLPLDCGALFMETGTGKTRTSIELMAKWHSAKQFHLVLIIAPLSISVNWKEEIEKWCWYPFHTQHIKDKRIELQPDKLNFIIVGTESMSAGGGFKKVKALIARKRIGLIIDESSDIKNFKSARTKKILELAGRADKRLILTGTSVTQGLEDLYTQYNTLHKNIIGLKSFYSFRNRYCIMGGFKGKKIIGYNSKDELMTKLKPYTVQVLKRDALDLPPETFITRHVTLTKEQAGIYQQLRDDLILYYEREDNPDSEIIIDNTLIAFLRMQEVLSGIIALDDGTKHMIKNPPKIKELERVVNEHNGQLVVFSRFTMEIDAVVEKFGCSKLDGSVSKEERQAIINEFQKGNIGMMVAHPAVGARGLNMHAANLLVYLSNSFSLEHREQIRGRIARIGQTQAMTYIDFLAPGTVDMMIHASLTSKLGLAESVKAALVDKTLIERI